MSEHLSLQQQTALLEHTLELRGLPQALAHLAECDACRAQLSRLRGTDELAAWGVEDGDWSFVQGHLGYEQMAGYVTETLAELEREIAGNHLSACEFCADEVRELRAVKDELKQLAAAHPATEKAVTATWQTRLKQTWRRLGSFSPALAWSVLLLLLSLAGWWVWQTGQSRRQELAVTNQAETAPPATSPVKPTTAPLPAAETLLAIVEHGQPLSLRADGQLSSQLALPPAYESLLKRTLSEQRLAQPALTALKSNPRQLRGEESTSQRFKLLAPFGKVVLSDRPVFHWQPVAGATSYTVAVLDDNFHTVLTSGALTQAVWRASQPLPRGRIYLWQVTAQVGDQSLTSPAATAPEARFQILAAAKAAELEQARRAFNQSHLLLGTLYTQAGLLDEAEHEFQALRAENPQSALVKKLLQQVRQTK